MLKPVQPSGARATTLFDRFQLLAEQRDWPIRIQWTRKEAEDVSLEDLVTEAEELYDEWVREVSEDAEKDLAERTNSELPF